MKRTFYFLSLLLVAVFTFCFSSCSEKEEGIVVDYTSDIIGLWVYDDGTDFEIFQFSPDGTMKNSGTFVDDKWRQLGGTWRFNKNRLEMTFEEVGDFVVTVEFVKGEMVAMTDVVTGIRKIFRFAKAGVPSQFVGTWTSISNGYAEYLSINADGSAVSTGRYEDGTLWIDSKGKVAVLGSIFTWEFDDGDFAAGQCQVIEGETMTITDKRNGKKRIFKYCKDDLSQTVLGMWFISKGALPNGSPQQLVCNFKDNGKVDITGVVFVNEGNPDGESMLHREMEYKVYGDLLMVESIAGFADAGKKSYQFCRMSYQEGTTTMGNVITLEQYVDSVSKTILSSMLSVKQYLELENRKYQYNSIYVSNAKGVDQEVDVFGVPINFGKMDGGVLDKLMKSLLMTYEFPTADKVVLSYYVNGQQKSKEMPITVDGNKLVFKMSSLNPALRDIECFAFQDFTNSQLHYYMNKGGVVNFGANILLLQLAKENKIDLNDKDAVDKLFNELGAMIESINMTYVFKAM